MSERHASRCDYCGQFMPWARWSSFNCFAGYAKAWCHRLDCVRRSHDEQVIRR